MSSHHAPCPLVMLDMGQSGEYVGVKDGELGRLAIIRRADTFLFKFTSGLNYKGISKNYLAENKISSEIQKNLGEIGVFSNALFSVTDAEYLKTILGV